MKFTKLDLLTLLISLFLFASCKNSNTIGLDLNPDEQINGTLVDTLTVLTKTMPDDSVVTWTDPAAPNLIRYPFGFLTDPILGTSEASLAMSVNLPSSAFRFGKNATLDSAVLVLPYSTQFYGDTTTSVYSVDVHQLKNDLSLASSFASNKEWPYEALVGNYTGKIRPTTGFQITDVVAGGPDTLKAAVAQMRVKLSTSWVQTNLLNIDTANLANTPTFTGIFKGFHVSINKTSSAGPGGIMYFDFSGANSRLELYYKRPNATTIENIDTVASNFPITTTVNPVAATIRHIYNPDVHSQLVDATNRQYNVTYLQGLGGLRNKVSFPYLKNFYNTFGTKPGSKIVINKAELVVDVSSGTDVAPFTPAPRLTLYRYDIAGRRINLADDDKATTIDPRATLFGGNYDLVNKKYVFVVTAYLQDLLDGKTVDYGTYLSTGSSTEFDITPPVTSAARSVIGSSINTTNKVRLNIYYTLIN